jgi:hypothetical protein
MKAQIIANEVEIDYGAKETSVSVKIDGQTITLFEGVLAEEVIRILREQLSEDLAERKIVGNENKVSFRRRNRIFSIADALISYMGMAPFIWAPKLLRELLHG